MAILSAVGIPLAVLAKRHRARRPHAADYAAAAAAHTHTIVTTTPA
jgi:hypothetical protein